MTTFDEHRNLALGTVSAGSTIIDSTTGDTIVAGSDAEAAEFPAVPFYATVWRDQTPTRPAVEIVRATAFDGARTFTVERAQQGTAAQAFVTQGWKFANTITVADVVAIEDAVTGGEAGLAAETAARESADTALQGDIAAEATARAAGDAATLSGAEAYADGKVSAEASARAAGDAATLAAAEGYSDSHVAAEAAARVAGDAATLASAEGYADGEVSAEATTRASADATLQTHIDSEATARASGDAATLGSAESYSDARLAAKTLASLADVALSSLTDADMLLWNAISQRFKNSPSSALLLGVPNLDESFATSGPKTISGTAEVMLSVFTAPYPMRITGFRVVSQSDAAADNSNFWIVRGLRRRASQPVTPLSDLILAAAPYAYWRLDEAVGAPSALDSGSGAHPLGYSTPPPTLGQPSLARRSSDTSATFVRASATFAASAVDYGWDFSNNQVTIMAFVKPTALAVGGSNRYTIFGRPDVGLQPSFEIGGGGSGASNGRFAIVVSGFFIAETTSFASLPNNDYLVAYRRSAWNGSQATEDFFVNGVKWPMLQFSQKAFTNSVTGTFIGKRKTSGNPVNQYFDGGIDELCVWNSALSDAQLQAFADTGAVQAEIARKTTQTVGSGGEGITGFQPWTFEGVDFNSYAQNLDQGDSIVLSFFPFGTPAALTDCIVEVTYEAL